MRRRSLHASKEEEISRELDARYALSGSEFAEAVVPISDPPATLGEARAEYVPPVARHDDGVTDYFATSLPELLLFSREGAED